MCTTVQWKLLHPRDFVELLGCIPRDYNHATITETWFRRLPIEEISWVRLRLLCRCYRRVLLYWADISGVCWVDGLRRTWVAWVRKSGQQMVLLPGPYWSKQGKCGSIWLRVKLRSGWSWRRWYSRRRKARVCIWAPRTGYSDIYIRISMNKNSWNSPLYCKNGYWN